MIVLLTNKKPKSGWCNILKNVPTCSNDWVRHDVPCYRTQEFIWNVLLQLCFLDIFYCSQDFIAVTSWTWKGCNQRTQGLNKSSVLYVSIIKNGNLGFTHQNAHIVNKYYLVYVIWLAYGNDILPVSTKQHAPQSGMDTGSLNQTSHFWLVGGCSQVFSQNLVSEGLLRCMSGWIGYVVFLVISI